MPYIKQERRDELNTHGQFAPGDQPLTAGELNYAITVLLLQYWRQSGPANYQRINDIIGACEGAKVEFQRRIVGDYEDRKIIENGDCYL